MQAASDMALAMVNGTSSGLGLVLAVVFGADGCELAAGVRLLCTGADNGQTWTMGNVVITSKSSGKFYGRAGLADHEFGHSGQWAAAGGTIPFLLSWGAMAGISWLGSTPAQQGGGGCWNLWELWAGPGGTYETKCAGVGLWP